MFFESCFNVLSLMFRNFLPLGPAFRVLREIFHRGIKMMSSHTGGFFFMFDVLDTFEYHLFGSLKICMFKSVLETQGIAETSRIEIMRCKAITIHTV